MNTINLFSNSFFDSGTCLPDIRDARWSSLVDDQGGHIRPREGEPYKYRTLTKGREPDTSAYIFNSVGIGCNYTGSVSGTDVVRLVDIGSYPDWMNAAKSANRLFNGKKFILFSSQEPCTNVDQVLNRFPNAFVMDAVYGGPTFDRHLPFPALFSRMLNPFFNIVIGYHTINLQHTQDKKFIYNNLKFRNEHNKALTQYFLYKKNLLDKGIVTYNRNKGSLSPRMQPADDSNDILSAFCDLVLENDSPRINKNEYTLDDFTDWYRRQNSMGLDISTDSFTSTKRYHPIYIYNETFFSLINESGGAGNGMKFGAGNGLTLFSEKSLYPIMQGHPFAVICADQQLYYKQLQELGFELYDEILDYSMPHDNVVDSIFDGIHNIENFDIGKYKSSITSTIRKSRHNRENFLNTHSKLWTTLRKLMISNLEKYFDACN